MKPLIRGILAFIILAAVYLGLVATYLETLSPRDVLGVAVLWLTWPAMVLSRVGIRYSSLVLVSAVVLVLSLRILKQRRPLFRLKFAPLFVVVYCALGGFYFVFAPVPAPALSRFDFCSEQLGAVYHQAFAEGYHWGMNNRWVIVDGVIPPAMSYGWFDGYRAGVGEWERVLPGITVARQRASIPGVRRATDRPLRELDLCSNPEAEIVGYAVP